MEAKEKVIKKVYGEYFEPLKDFIDENGWCRNRKISGFYNQLFHIQFHSTINYWYRPAALKNIENNNTPQNPALSKTAVITSYYYVF